MNTTAKISTSPQSRKNVRSKTRLLTSVCFIFIATFFLYGCVEDNDSTGGTEKLAIDPEVNILAWVGYNETDFIKSIESETGADISVKTYVGGDEMYSLYKSAPEDTYDIVIVDIEYGARLFQEGEIKELDDTLIRSRSLMEPFASGHLAALGGARYAIPIRWGALGLVYNTERITDSEADSYNILFAERLTGRVGIFDWYLPNMGVISKYLKAQHEWSTPSAFSLSIKQLSQLKHSLLNLRPQVATIQPSTGDVIASLRSGQAWIVPGIGEWAAVTLQREGLPFAWKVPKEGGVMWIEAIALTGRGSAREIVQQVTKAIQKPEILAQLMWRKAYVSQSPSLEAYTHLSDSQRKLLKASDLSALEDLAKSLEIRRLPGPADTYTGAARWQSTWQAFKTNKQD